VAGPLRRWLSLLVLRLFCFDLLGFQVLIGLAGVWTLGSGGLIGFFSLGLWGRVIMSPMQGVDG
jgi:hypothetical protein